MHKGSIQAYLWADLQSKDNHCKPTQKSSTGDKALLAQMGVQQWPGIKRIGSNQLEHPMFD